jgi:hypothetical protein
LAAAAKSLFLSSYGLDKKYLIIFVIQCDSSEQPLSILILDLPVSPWRTMLLQKLRQPRYF